MPELRDAASLLVLKQEGGVLRILMGLRHANHKFLPNLMVFPGGAVDADDFSAAVATPLNAAVLAQLEVDASPELAAALAHAAARELAEETGLTLGNPPALDGLHYLCRAETPESRPIRFNARFFIADAALVTGELAGSGELEALDWYALERVLSLDIAPPTRAALEQLQIWLGLDEAQRGIRKIPVRRAGSWGID
jgi:8-oxo-dGTP pyrophosphatase MutT (NUDIX family)